jgi:hypothetical protein
MIRGDDGPWLDVGASGTWAAVASRVGVPLPRGWVEAPDRLVALEAESGRPLPLQGRVLARWPDRSVKWLLCDVALPAALACDGGRLRLARRGDAQAASCAAGVEGVQDSGPALSAAALCVTPQGNGLEVDTGAAVFRFSAHGDAVLAAVSDRDRQPLLGPAGLRLRLSDAAGRAVAARVDAVALEEQGPVRAVLALRGGFGSGCPLEFVARWSISAGTGDALLTLRLRNPRPALHPGGAWDLGDPGSWHVGDLSLEAEPAFSVSSLERRAAPQERVESAAPADWCLYQDSSGGERWDSPNHVEADGRPGVRFRGWRIRAGGADARTGLRAQPALAVLGGAGAPDRLPCGMLGTDGAASDAAPVDEAGPRGIGVSLRDFWQNFPKALRWRDGRLSVGLFPAERGRPTELQGGEQKRHVVAFAFGGDALVRAERGLAPVATTVDPRWVESTGAVPGFVADLDACPAWTRHVRTIVDGPDSFEARREQVDEYGWRHFGELWADHEAVRHAGPQPFVSHYNNQYDFVFAAGLHAMRTGDPRWERLAREAAEHVTDIDVYHTSGDRAAFNGGLFWHTDHHVPAATATHRTYSRANAAGAAYGGGPSNEHAYASGLLLHWWRTGDPDAHEAVLGLGDWIVAMDDGSRTLLGVLDAGPTGLASRTVEPGYHGPGRGAGNAVATLLDAFRASGARRYLAFAESLLRRCVHPADDVDAHGLDDVEHRWSYLVFLQAIGRYLELKRELGENDWMFQYARASLLRYADWMLEHEVPYRDVLHRVELPTESWPAHDLRKCEVLHVAARYDDRGREAVLRERAVFFHDRCLADLEGFATRHLTRPLVLLAVHGHLDAHHARLVPIPAAERSGWRHAHDFGMPRPFVGQRERVVATLRPRLATAVAELRRIARDRLAALRRRTGAGGKTGAAR